MTSEFLNGEAIFTEHFELIPVIAVEMIVQRFPTNCASYPTISVETPKNNRLSL
jgi:hypothetical protein